MGWVLTKPRWLEETIFQESRKEEKGYSQNKANINSNIG